ncbi:MAG: ferritin-like domain-containing protein, partial [Chloroflexota bacterium]|nr:ferritin-like domain-containing protein [Chloroflexota bacterium]
MPSNAAKIKAIFTVARTAEQLAVTFYSNGVKNAAVLGLTPTQLGQIQAALVEEQLHQILFTAQGGDSLADTFSFPQGAATFTNLQTFIATQQMLEGVFDSAFLAAVREFAEIGEPQLAQIASQIASVESEHRALGRAIAGLEPADNWTYAPVLERISYLLDRSIIKIACPASRNIGSIESQTALVLRHRGCDGIEACQCRARLAHPESPLHRRLRDIACLFPTRHFPRQRLDLPDAPIHTLPR